MIGKAYNFALNAVMLLATLSLGYAYIFYVKIGNFVSMFAKKRIAAKAKSK